VSDEIEPQILDHLVVEFGEYGRRAADFLRSAQALRSMDLSHLQRWPAMLAYCLREAMMAILSSQDQGGAGEWGVVSRRVTEAKKRYTIAHDLPGSDEEEALGALLASIDELEQFHSRDGINEQRLIAIVLNQTGSFPLSEGTTPVRDYQNLLSRLNGAVHSETNTEIPNSCGRTRLRFSGAFLCRQKCDEQNLIHLQRCDRRTVEIETLFTNLL